MIKLYVAKAIAKMGRKATPYFLSKIGIANSAARSILYTDAKTINLNNIFLLCNWLHCTPNDLLNLSPQAIAILPKGHPLLALVKEETANLPVDIIKTMPYNKLNEAALLLQALKDRVDE